MAPTMCSDCHEPDPTGQMMLVKTFSDVCGSCHLDQIEGSSLAGPKGIAFLNVPGLDLETLRERDAEIGEWPEFADAKPTPFLGLLLESSSDRNLDLVRIRKLDLLDLTDASDDDILAVSRMAWAIKELVHDLLNLGFEEPGKALSAQFGQELDRVAIRRMVGGLSLDTLRAASSSWFPSLSQEVALYRAGIGVPIPGESVNTVAAVESDPGTRIDDGEDILSGAAGDGKEGDILAGLETESQGENILGEAASGSKDDDILAGLGAGGQSDDILGEAASSSKDGDILAGLGTEGQDDDILGAPGTEAELLSLSGSEENLLASSSVSEEAVEPSLVDAEAWSNFGGWYLQYFTIYYRPLGHADRFLRTWLDVSANAFGTVNEPAGDAIFRQLIDDDSPGQCGKCHTVDREQDGRLNVKWKPALPRPGVKSFTKFAHDTHFSLLDEMGCKTCHSFAMARAENGEAPSMDFEKMSLEACATCHVERKAGDTCLLCHNYHVGKFPIAPVPTRMQTAVSSTNQDR